MPLESLSKLRHCRYATTLLPKFTLSQVNSIIVFKKYENKLTISVGGGLEEVKNKHVHDIKTVMEVAFEEWY